MNCSGVDQTPLSLGMNAAQLEAKIRALVADWRGILERQGVEAKPIIEGLLAERIVVTPLEQRGEFRVCVPLTSGRLLEGLDRT